MRIYEFEVQEGYEWVMPVVEAEVRVFMAFDGSTKRSGWTPIRMRLIKEDERGRPRRPADIPWFARFAPVLKEKASAALGPVLERDGELLPLACVDARLDVFNVTTVLDALDMDRSAVLKLEDSGRIMKVESHVFRSDRLEGAHAFKVPGLRSSVFVTDEVVSAANDAGLIGVGFRLLWDERTKL